MPRASCTLVLLLVIGIVALSQPVEALCKVKGSNIRSTDDGAPSVHSTNNVPTAATAIVGPSAGNTTSEVDAGDISDRSSDNKIQHAPKKRMKNKIAFDAVPAKAKTNIGASQKGKNSSS
ncbi:hypothetical protein FI667_g1479, partial [Globisporangium splendens]